MSSANFSLKQQQSQQQKMSYQLIQSISLLPMSVEELREKIYEEVDKNPALEIVQDGKNENPIIRKKLSEKSSAANSADSDTFQAFLESSPSQSETLQDNLLEQLHVSNLSKEEVEIGEKIIQNLDENGYHVVPLSRLLSNSFESVTVEKVLKLIQSFDPVGVCCSGLQESLLIQAQDKNPSKLVIDLLDKYFDILQSGKASTIQKKLADKNEKVTTQQIEEAISFIKTLEPHPASNYSIEQSIFVSPDVLVAKLLPEEIDENNSSVEYKITLVKENYPEIQISKDFLAFQDKDATVKKAVQDANQFINAINQRNSTLIKISTEIVRTQKQFFDKGKEFLKPLRMKDIADAIGVHETTVSRIASSKYLQCEWGIFEIKYFFSNAVEISQSNNDVMSKESIKQKLKAIIEKEGSLSDQKLSDKLAEQGISIARRTVAKYRAELNFNSSYDR